MSIATAFAEVVLIFAAGASTAIQPSAEEILTQYEHSLTRFNRFSVTAEGTRFYRRADQAQERLDASRRIRVLRDNDRWNIVVSQRTFPFGGPTEGFGNEFNYVCNGHVLEVYYPQKKIGVRPDLPSAVNGGPTNSPREQTRAINFLGPASLSFGHFNNVDTRYSLPQIFRSATANKAALRSGRDEVGTFIESTTLEGDTLRLWIDPEAGGSLKGLRAIQAADASNANRFRHDRMMVESVYGFAHTAAIKSITFEVRGVKTALCEDRHVVTKFETIRTLEAVDGTTAYERFEGRLTDWNLSPNVDSPTAFQPVLPVPENSNVYNPKEESIQYAYRGGQVVLDINQSTVNELAKVKLSSHRSQGRMQWAWAAIAGVLGFIWWRMRAADAT